MLDTMAAAKKVATKTATTKRKTASRKATAVTAPPAFAPNAAAALRAPSFSSATLARQAERQAKRELERQQRGQEIQCRLGVTDAFKKTCHEDALNGKACKLYDECKTVQISPGGPSVAGVDPVNWPIYPFARLDAAAEEAKGGRDVVRAVNQCVTRSLHTAKDFVSAFAGQCKDSSPVDYARWYNRMYPPTKPKSTKSKPKTVVVSKAKSVKPKSAAMPKSAAANGAAGGGGLRRALSFGAW